MQLTTKLERDEIVDKVCKDFTYDFQDTYTFTKHQIEVPEFNIGLIVGSSGSGKSLLLKDFNDTKESVWEEKAICSHFDTYEDATDKLMAAGFNSIPMWLVPYRILSTGQKYRVDLARTLKDNAVFDEYTSVIDRPTALSLSNSVQKYIRKKNLKSIVFASVHHDIINYLKPDWIYDTDKETLTINNEVYSLQIEDGKVKYSKVDEPKKVKSFMEIKSKL